MNNNDLKPDKEKEIIGIKNARIVADDLEKKLNQSLISNLDESCKTIFENIPSAIEFSKNYISDSALVELNAQKRCHWPNGSGVYYSDKECQIKSIFRNKRWCAEEEVLEARNIRRANKLWQDSKEKFEKRYHRNFRYREDMSIMFGIFNKKQELLEKENELKEAINEREKFKEFAKIKPDVGFEKAVNFWEKHVVLPKASDCASLLVDLLKDIANPVKLFKETIYQKREGRTTHQKGRSSLEDSEWEEIENDSDLISWDSHGHSTEFPKSEGEFYSRTAKYLVNIFLEDKQDILSFSKAISLLEPDTAKESGIENKKIYIRPYDLPKDIESILNKTLKKRYNKRKPDDETSRFMEWYSGKILTRWKATAVDHDRLFDYHDPHYLDKRLMSVFWRIREGREFNQKSKEHFYRRLPGVLRAMVEDGVLTPDQIDPPLKEKYLEYNEVLTFSPKGGKLISGKSKSSKLISLTMEPSQQVIATNSQKFLMLPGTEKTRSIIKPKESLDCLASVLDPDKTYQVLFKGKHSLFLGNINDYPSGFQGIGDIYRITLLPENVDLKEGSLVNVDGKRFNVTKQKSDKVREEISNSIWDSNVNALSAESYTIIVDSSPEEFKEKYFTDFMAHVLIHRPNITLDDLFNDLECIEKLDAVGLDISVGTTGRANIKTFDIEGKFGFIVKNENHASSEEVPFITKTLIDYVRDVGLPIHTEVNLDESGRYAIKKKIEDREFAKENLEQIIQSLKGQGLPKALSYALKPESKCSLWNFGESPKACEDCGKNYVTGNISRPDLHEQWCEGFNAKNLHDLSYHPQTFRFEFDNLRKIHRFLSEVSEYQFPLFEQPEIIPEFKEFAKAYEEYLHAGRKSYNFWESTCGGINAEEEEIQDDPELRGLRDKEKELYKNEKNSRDKAEETAIKLQIKYDNLKGIKTESEKDINKIMNFWSDQIMVYGIYQTSAPNLLTFQGQETLGDIVKLYRS
jgi:hypothetical protein